MKAHTLVAAIFSSLFVSGCDSLIGDFVGGGGESVPSGYSYCASTPNGGCCSVVTKSNGSVVHTCVSDFLSCESKKSPLVTINYKTEPGKGFCEAIKKTPAFSAPSPLGFGAAVAPLNCANYCASSPSPPQCSSLSFDNKYLTQTLKHLNLIFNPTTTEIKAAEYLAAFDQISDPCMRGDISVSSSQVDNIGADGKACNLVVDQVIGLPGFQNLHLDLTVPPILKAKKEVVDGESRVLFLAESAPVIALNYQVDGYGSGRLNSLGYVNDTLWVGVGQQCIGISKK
jgi:hypothetical protein